MSEVGFCEKCGIVREDEVIDRSAVGKPPYRIPITDCPCTAQVYGHMANCGYTKACGQKIDVGIRCKHGHIACEGCQCDCYHTTLDKLGRPVDRVRV